MATEQVDMGRITVHAAIENLFDIAAVAEGRRSAEDIRRVEVDDALVDTGATLFSMPRELIDQLGLIKYSSRTVLSSGGPLEAGMYGAVRLTVQGRTCVIDVMEVPVGVPVLIGQIALEHLDFVIDPRNRTLIGNPAHGGEHMYELY